MKTLHRLPPRSLQARLLAVVLSLVLLIWAAASATVWFDARHELDELLDAHLAQAAALLVAQQPRLLGHESDDDMGDGEGEGALEDAAPELHRYAPRVAFQVFHEGRLSLRSRNAPLQPMVGEEQGFRTGLRSVQIAGETWRVFASHGAERDVQVYVAEQQRSRGEILMALLRGAFGALLLALPLLAATVWWAVRRGTRPLRELSRTLAQRAPDALEPVQLRDTPSEMEGLLLALNQLLQRSQAMMAAERRFTADAAHELRTPIAAIRAQAQVAQGAQRQQDSAGQTAALQATLQGCERASRLVEQLLTLARLEHEGQCLLPGQPVDLALLAREVAAELAPTALQRGQDLSLDCSGPCTVPGNPALLAVLIRNLLDNALRYSPDGARIELQLRGAAGRVELQLADSGAGLDEAQLARLGERFFRALGSPQPGSGLGWSIVRRIAEAHRARISVGRSAALGGLEVRVSWAAPG